MSDVEFSNERTYSSGAFGSSQKGGFKFADFLIRNGIANDANSANKVLLILAIIFFIAAILVAL